MNSVIKPKKTEIGATVIPQGQHYNRQQIKRAKFVLMNDEDLFGRYDKKSKDVVFEFIPIESASIYSYKHAVMLWQLAGMKPDHIVKMIYRHPKLGLLTA